MKKEQAEEFFTEVLEKKEYFKSEIKSKSIFDNIDSISIFKNGSTFGYEHWYKPETMLIVGNWGNKSSPIAYIHKPKSISLEDWDRFKDKLQINLLK